MTPKQWFLRGTSCYESGDTIHLIDRPMQPGQVPWAGQMDRVTFTITETDGDPPLRSHGLVYPRSPTTGDGDEP